MAKLLIRGNKSKKEWEVTEEQWADMGARGQQSGFTVVKKLAGKPAETAAAVEKAKAKEKETDKAEDKE